MNTKPYDDERIKDVEQLLLAGVSAREIARKMHMSRATVDRVATGRRRQRGRPKQIIERADDWLPDDYGKPIPGSRWVRNYCRRCREPGRTEIAGYWICECQGKVIGYDTRKGDNDKHWSEAS